MREVDIATGEDVVRLKPARSDITIRHLLTHTSGISYTGPQDADGKFSSRISQGCGTNRQVTRLARHRPKDHLF